jgi:hypothetical protein
VHTLYDNVIKYNEAVCGTFINIADFVDGAAHPVRMELIIPFDDIAALQAFSFYPNAVVGDIELNFYVGSAGLVWCPVDPKVVYDIKTTLQEISIPVDFPEHALRTTSHYYGQINNNLWGINSFNVTTTEEGSSFSWVSDHLHLFCNSLRVISCESNMAGFQVRESTLTGIRDIFSTPVNIPAEYLEYNAFPTPPDEHGLRSTLNTMLNNVKDIYVMFPKRTNDVTVFENPCIDQFCIRCMGVQYPEKVVSTLGPRFYQYSLNAADLGAHLRPTTEFVDSYTQFRNDPENDGLRFPNRIRDGSSFALIVQTERNESGYVFDGLDSDGQSTPIDIQFVPMYAGANDTYYNFDSHYPTLHPPAPQVWLCRNVYWSIDVENGLMFHKYGTPDGLEIAT